MLGGMVHHTYGAGAGRGGVYKNKSKRIIFSDPGYSERYSSDAVRAMEYKQKLAVVEYNRLTCFIAGVEDSLIRQILRFRYIDMFSWNEVAKRVGGNNTADGVRKIAERFVQRY